MDLARFLVIILPPAENMLSGAAEEAGTTRTFRPKRTIHGTTEEARLNSVRGFLCDGNGYTRETWDILSIETSGHNLDL